MKSFKRFLQEVNFFSPPQYVYLDFNKIKKNRIHIDDIVYLCADKMTGSESNNKQIHFINRSPANLIDFSFTKMEEKGLMKSQFVTIHKSFRVNKKYIKCYHPKTESIEISIFDALGKTKCHYLPVSENYQAVIKKSFWLTALIPRKKAFVPALPMLFPEAYFFCFSDVVLIDDECRQI